MQASATKVVAPGAATLAGVLLAVVHLGPTAVEPPRDVIEPYDATVVGVTAFGVLLLLMFAVAASFAVEVRDWRHERRAAGRGGH